MQQTVIAQAGGLARGTVAIRLSSAARSLVVSPLAQKSLVARGAQRLAVRASATEQNVDVEELVKDLQEKWEKVDNKPAVIVYTVAAISAVWLSSTVVGAVNNLPLIPKVFELVGLGYSAWFTYRYLLFKSSREELVEDIEALKKKISGEQ